MQEDDGPYVINEELCLFLKKFGRCLVPKRRRILLIFDVFETTDLHPNIKPIGDDIICPGYCIIFAIRTIAGFLYQPIGTVFLYKNTLPEKLAKCVKAYIHDLSCMCDLKVIATVSSTNVILTSMVDVLISKPNNSKMNLLTYNVGSVENIVHIYDPPCLIKEMYDIFMEFKIKYVYKGENYTINNKDLLNGPKNQAQSVLQQQINDHNSTTSKFEKALKLFCEAMFIELKIKGNDKSRGCAQFFLFIDQLFDSLNAYEPKSPKYRMVVTRNSKHFELWKHSIYAFETMVISKMTNDVPNEKQISYLLSNLLKLSEVQTESELQKLANIHSYRPIVLDQWIYTIKGVSYLCQNLLKRYKDIQTRHFNLDPIYEVVDYIKSVNSRKKNPSLHIINIGYLKNAFKPDASLTLY